MNDVSRITLGGGAWHDWDVTKLSNLLMAASHMGISNIDTAPTYGNSEYLLGKALKGLPKFMVSTKVGKAGAFDLDGKSVVRSVEKSLNQLSLEKIDCVFLHSVHFKYVKDSAINALIDLKKHGIINKIGVSCDGNDFYNFFSLSVFDKFMMTLNLVDQINLNHCLNVSETGLTVSLKRSLANGVFRSDFKAILLKYFRIYNREIFGGEKESYYFRHKIMSQKFGKRLKYFHYANFAFQAVPKSEVLIGTRSIHHLKSFRAIEKSEVPMRSEIEEFKDLFSRANSFNWSAQI